MATREMKSQINNIMKFVPIDTIAEYIDTTTDSLKQDLVRKAKAAKKASSDTPKKRKINLFDIYLDMLQEYQVLIPKGLKDIEVMDNVHFREFLKEFNKTNEKIAIELFKNAIQKYRQDHIKKDHVAIFKEKFGSLSEDSFDRASEESPDLLVNLIQHGEISPFLKGLALDSLSIGARDEYIGFIKSFLDAESPFLREGAYLALYEYYDSDREKYSDLKSLFSEALKEEEGPGVREQIEELYYLMG